jgi:hypothetical protein
MSEPISASPAQPADGAAAANDNNPPPNNEAVFAVMTAMAEYYASTWDKTEELRTLRRDRLMLHYGWSAETIARFKIGFDDGGVVEHLTNAGFTREQMVATGAFRIDTYNHVVSRFEGRIVFPYIDGEGVTRYFTARATPLTSKWKRDGEDVEPPKYVKLSVHKETKDGDDDGISPAVQNVIWTTHENIKKQKFGIIAEGVADAISAAQAGYPVRSPVTTTFKEADADNIDALISAWDTAVLIPDMECNESGIKGAVKTAKKLIEKGRDIRIAILPHEGIKAAAEARVETLRTERVAEGKTPTEKEINQAGDWKVDLNEFLAAPAESKVIMARLADLKGFVRADNAEDTATFEVARAAALQAIQSVRARRKDDLRGLVDGASPALDVMIAALPEEPAPNDWGTRIHEVTETIALIKNDAEREAWLDRLKAHVGGRIGVLRGMVEQECGEDEEAEEAEEENPLTAILTGLSFFRVLTGRVFTVVDGLSLPVDGEEFAAWLSHECHGRTGKVVGPTTIKDAIRAVVGVSTKLPLGVAPIRYAYDNDGGIWVDLADKDGNFVHVTARTVKIEKRCPIAFYRPAGTGAMAVPELTEKPEVAACVLEEFFDFLAVGRKSRAGLFAIIMSAMRPMEHLKTGALTRYTVGVFNGEHGSGKSTRQMFVRRTIDPREPASMKMPDKVDDLCIYSENSAVVSLDNQSNLSLMMSDALCRVATGDGNVKRSLFTTRDLAVFRGARPILVNGITDVVTRDDLLDRSLIVHVERPEETKTDDELEDKFKELWPRVFGGLCFCMMEALDGHADREVNRAIRMLQAARWAAAAEVAAGFDTGAVEQAYMAAREEAVAIAADDPFVTAFLAVVGKDWKSTVTKLTEELVAHVEARDPVTGKATKRPPKGFPTTVPMVRSTLKRKMPALRQLGVEVERTEERTATASKVAFVHFTRKVVESDAVAAEPETTPTNGYNGTGMAAEYGGPTLDDV